MVNPSAAPDPPLGFPDPPRSRFEFLVRFGFGFLFGILLGFYFSSGVFGYSSRWWLGFPVVSGFICAILAGKFGDRFWTWFRVWWYG
jgi:hypothetical protein